MSTKTTTPTNGKAEEVKTSTNTAKVLPVTVDFKKEETPLGKEAADLPPLEDRLHKLNQLFSLQQKYNRLQTSLQRLKAFELSKDDETCRIGFIDKNRNEFATGNPELMPEFLGFLKSVIQRKIKELEPLLKW